MALLQLHRGIEAHRAQLPHEHDGRELQLMHLGRDHAHREAELEGFFQRSAQRVGSEYHGVVRRARVQVAHDGDAVEHGGAQSQAEVGLLVARAAARLIPGERGQTRHVGEEVAHQVQNHRLERDGRHAQHAVAVSGRAELKKLAVGGVQLVHHRGVRRLQHALEDVEYVGRVCAVKVLPAHALVVGQ